MSSAALIFRTLVLGVLAAWLSAGNASCSCAPSASRSRQEAKVAQASAKESPPNTEPASPASATAASGNRPTSKAHGAETESQAGPAPISGSKASESSPQDGKAQGPAQRASIAEGLFGKSQADGGQTSPAEAHSKAAKLEREAIELEKKGRSSEAFEKALAAWHLVRVHEEDAACCGLTQRLEPVLERLGEAASAGKYRSTSKPLRVQ